ncbi:MAG: glycosyltransferase family 4 protein [Anaerolineae bacterium]|nr:glycosyltransferase family 4 protein [Anaerolineae bacterium]
MITQKLDSTDPLLAFTVEWVRRLAVRLEHLDVLCLEVKIPPSELPANVTAWSMGKERGYGRARELIEFYRVLLKVAPKTDAIFSHMVPRYAYLSMPIALPFNLPVYLWYTHRQDTRELRMATAVCEAVMSAVPESFPFETPKLRAVGHGVDTAFFASDPTIVPDLPPVIAQVARLTPIKHQETLIRALSLVPHVRAAIVGNVPPGKDETYQTQLETLATVLGVANRVEFTGGLPAEQVRDLVRRATIAVNLSPPGLFDKAALESMMVGTLTIVSNPAFDGLLRDHASLLRISAPDAVDELVKAIKAILALPAQTRADIALDIQGRARTAHGIDGLMDRLVEIMRPH